MLLSVILGLGWLLGLSGCGDGTRRSPEPQVSHYERNEKKDRVIVFVHGIFSSAIYTCTCSKNKVYWHVLLLQDSAFADSDVYVVAYETPYLGNRMTIDEVVSSMANRFEYDKVFSHREVVFVAHSLGGLVVQRFLLTHREYAKRVPFIFFYSTPETGSQLARLAQVFSADPLLDQMFPGDKNGYLLNLENEWIAANFEVKRFCAYETKPLKGVLVVDRLSGTRNCGNKTPIPITKDHSDIVKPCSAQDD
jgi:pimeloyl-ACP methyl ester carboxylesterase